MRAVLNTFQLLKITTCFFALNVNFCIYLKMKHEYRLYRHFDKDNNLLYVGISIHLIARVCQHSNSSDWFSAVRLITIETHGSMKDLNDAETNAILSEKPVYNKQKTKAKMRITESDNSPIVSSDFNEFYSEVLQKVKKNWKRTGNSILGLSDAKVSRLFTGKQKDFETLLKMAGLMQIKIEFRAE